jgi:hypothetical protein
MFIDRISPHKYGAACENYTPRTTVIIHMCTPHDLPAIYSIIVVPRVIQAVRKFLEEICRTILLWMVIST